MALYQVAVLGKVLAEDLNQLVKALTGLAAHAIKLDGDYGSSYSLSVRQRDTGNGNIAEFLNPAGQQILKVTKNGVRLSRDGAALDKIPATMDDLAAITSGSGFYSGFSGEVRLYAGSAAPSGWLLCNGQAVSRTTYAALFAIIGTTFGTGDGSTTFNVPNFVDKVPMGAGGGTSGRSLARGQTGGSFNLPTHNHTVNIEHNHDVGLPQGETRTVGDGGSQGSSQDHGHDTTTDGGTKTTSTSSSSLDARQPSLGINFIIRT